MYPAEYRDLHVHVIRHSIFLRLYESGSGSLGTSTWQVLPHQFVGRTAAGIKDVVAEGCVSCSLVKGGIDIKPEGMELCSEATPGRGEFSASIWRDVLQ